MVRGELTGLPRAGFRRVEPLSTFLEASKGGRHVDPPDLGNRSGLERGGEARAPELTGTQGAELEWEWLATIGLSLMAREASCPGGPGGRQTRPQCPAFLAAPPAGTHSLLVPILGSWPRLDAS